MSSKRTPVRRVLTGITPSGMPHLGNYAGAIRPAIAASRQAGVEGFYFLADYHALSTIVDPARLQRSTLETAATWLAAGLDGRKMSKSYHNTIPLFAAAVELKKQIFSIVTDSRGRSEPKDTADSTLFQLYQAFASPEESTAMRAAFAGGISWGEVKQALFERIDSAVARLRGARAEPLTREA